jgi:hypothetical protein
VYPKGLTIRCTVSAICPMEHSRVDRLFACYLYCTEAIIAIIMTKLKPFCFKIIRKACLILNALGYCYKAASIKLFTLLQDVPQNSATQHGGAGLILLGRGKRLLYMGREFAPSGTEVFRNHRKSPAIFTMKKGRMRMVGSNSVPLDYYSCPLPLDHGYHVLNLKKYTVINIE